MTKTSAREKGDVLEDAVHAIEDTILKTAPGFAEGTFRIESKRIVSLDGVRHEIDLFVTAALPSGYDAVFVFECKNWEEKVGKNEIIIFSQAHAAAGRQLLFHCNQGQSRAPSLALLHLAKNLRLLDATSYKAAAREFVQVYPSYTPGRSIQLYLEEHWEEF